MTYDEVIGIANECLLPRISRLYGLEGYGFSPIQAHTGGRNLLYECTREGADDRILRFAFLNDRSREHLLAEVEFMAYLSEHGGGVPDVIRSREGYLLESLTHGDHTLHVCLFEKARGRKLVENHYRYRDGVPITEYHYNCGKALGKLHRLSKRYAPVHRRYGFSDKYNAGYIENLIPGSLPLLKERMIELLNALEGFDKDLECFGLVHFDFNDGNYSIDFDNGQITVYDFDNSCYCWYMFDLASLWTNGMGWTAFEPNPDKRRAFMDEYFKTALEGYVSETGIDGAMLEKLPLFIQANLMEGIVDAFEVARNNGKAPECDEGLSYRIKCMEDNIPFMGFFSDMYSCEEPFECEARSI